MESQAKRLDQRLYSNSICWSADRLCTVGPNFKKPPKLRSKIFLNLTGHSYACNNLTNFEYEANALTWHHVNLLKLAWKNSWNQVILFLADFWPFGPTVRRRLTIIDREKLTVTITTLPRDRLDDKKCQKWTNTFKWPIFTQTGKIGTGKNTKKNPTGLEVHLEDMFWV